MSYEAYLKAREIGALLPAIMMLGPEGLIKVCDFQISRSPQIGKIPLLKRELVLDYAASLPPTPMMIDPSTISMVCEDFLAGAGESVFLNVPTWQLGMVSKYGGKLNGFAFDAVDLIRRGAKIKKEWYDYEWIFWDIMNEIRGNRSWDRMITKDKKAREALKEKILSGLQSAREAKEISGLEAEQFVRNLGHGQTVEMTWDGPLSLELAIEDWGMEIA